MIAVDTNVVIRRLGRATTQRKPSVPPPYLLPIKSGFRRPFCWRVWISQMPSPSTQSAFQSNLQL